MPVYSIIAEWDYPTSVCVCVCARTHAIVQGGGNVGASCLRDSLLVNKSSVSSYY